MTPILGQGLNCGLEDVIVLADALQQHGGDIDSALPAYHHARWPDVEAMLNINEIVARRDYTLLTKASVLLCNVFVISTLGSVLFQTVANSLARSTKLAVAHMPRPSWPRVYIQTHTFGVLCCIFQSNMLACTSEEVCTCLCTCNCGMCACACIWLQETATHKLWLLSHGLLLKLHVATHTLLHNALPGVFLEPSMTQMLKGKVPYRRVMQSMYRDGIILAGLCALAVTSIAHLVRGSNTYNGPAVT